MTALFVLVARETRDLRRCQRSASVVVSLRRSVVSIVGRSSSSMGLVRYEETIWWKIISKLVLGRSRNDIFQETGTASP